jgi:hypothetical protein
MFLEVSAKLGSNVKALFRKVANALPGVEGLQGGEPGAGGAIPQSIPIKTVERRDPFLVTPSRMNAASKEKESAGSPGACGSC